MSADEATRTAAQPRMREALGGARSPEFAAWAVPALRSVVDLLLEQPEVDGSVGVVGFCFGGSYSFALALAEPRLRAAIAFYGAFPETGDPATIDCPVLAFYGEEDHGITDGVPDLEQRMADGRRRLHRARLPPGRARLLQRHLAVALQRRGCP